MLSLLSLFRGCPKYSQCWRRFSIQELFGISFWHHASCLIGNAFTSVDALFSGIIHPFMQNKTLSESAIGLNHAILEAAIVENNSNVGS